MLKVTDKCFEEAWSNSDNQRIIKNVASFFRKQIPTDELEQLGYIALFKCLLKHDVEKGNKFTSSLHRYILWECLKAVRRPSSPPISPLPDDLLDKHTDYFDIHDCVNLLPRSQRDLIHDYYFSRMTLREIGRRKGKNHVSVRNDLQQAVSAFGRLYQR